MTKARNVKSNLTECFKELHLPAMRQSFEEEAERARAESLSFEQYLLCMAEREIEARRQNRVARLLRQSRLPLEKTFESFERKRLPVKIDRQLNVLLEGGFLDRCENLLAFGNPGSGKTHLLCAIGHELVRQGRSVLFTTCSNLVQELLRAKRDLKLDRALKRLGGFEALILDDIGYV